MNNLLALYYKYDYQCPITIEAQEEDYVAGTNCRGTLKTLKQSK